MITTAHGVNAAAASGNNLFTAITLTYPSNYAILGSLTMTLVNDSGSSPASAEFFLEYSVDAGATWVEIKKFTLVAPGILVLENLGGTMVIPTVTDTTYIRTIRGRYVKANATDTLDVSLDYNLVVA
jgi:hypothetical protein